MTVQDSPIDHKRVHCWGGQFRAWRKQAGKTIEEAERESGVSGLGPIERGMRGCEVLTLRLLVEYYRGKCGVTIPADIVNDLIRPRQWPGLLEEFVRQAHGSSGSRPSLQISANQISVSREPMLDLAEHQLLVARGWDYYGDANRAIEVIGNLLRDPWPPELELRIRVSAAIYHDHAGQPETGLQILKPLLTRVAESEGTWWASYQYGVLLLHSGDSQAKPVLDNVHRHSPRPDHRNSARHQLAVIAMKEGDWGWARNEFEKCAAYWRACVAESERFRVAQPLWRLFDLCSVRDKDAAREYRRELEHELRRRPFPRISQRLV